jgi:hypothetical protein
LHYAQQLFHGWIGKYIQNSSRIKEKAILGPEKNKSIERGHLVIKTSQYPFIILAVATLLAAGCMQPVDNTPGGPQRSRCDQCHPYPSNMCKMLNTTAITGSDTLSGGNTCFACHRLSIIKTPRARQVYLDNGTGFTQTAEVETVFIDSSFSYDRFTFSVTDTGHLDGQVELAIDKSQPARCNSCHAFPPQSGAHAIHLDQGLTCHSCHANTISYDSAAQAQRGTLDMSGMFLPLIGGTGHLNDTMDVMDEQGLFSYDKTTKGCTQVGCHGDKSWFGGDAGGLDKKR